MASPQNVLYWCLLQSKITAILCAPLMIPLPQSWSRNFLSYACLPLHPDQTESWNLQRTSPRVAPTARNCSGLTQGSTARERVNTQGATAPGNQSLLSPHGLLSCPVLSLSLSCPVPSLSRPVLSYPKTLHPSHSVQRNSACSGEKLLILAHNE